MTATIGAAISPSAEIIFSHHPESLGAEVIISTFFQVIAIADIIEIGIPVCHRFLFFIIFKISKRMPHTVAFGS
jgi:hypothetical protein